MYRVRSCAHCGEPIRVNEPAVMIDEPIVAISAMRSEGAHLWMYFHEACYLASEGAGATHAGATGAGASQNAGASDADGLATDSV